MAFSITNLNYNPNRVWFVRLADAGSNISIELYTTLTDAQAQTNKQAYGTAAFGADQAVTLTNVPAATYPVSLFQDSYTWHLRVTGQDGNTTKIFKLKEFVDLDDISAPIYRNEELIPLRAAAEINAHTHARIPREIELASHLPTLEAGDIVRVNSVRLDVDLYGQVTEHRTAGEPNKLTSTIEVTSYLALKR